MSHFPRLPELPPAAEPETATQYGLRVLAFVLVTQVTATLTDEDLAQADHAFPVAVSNPEISILAAETLAECRRLVCGAIARRATQPAQETAQGAPAGVDRPNIGPGAALLPRPVQQPPAGSQETPAIVPAAPAAPRPAAVPPVPVPQAPRLQPRPAAVPVVTREQFAF